MVNQRTSLFIITIFVILLTVLFNLNTNKTAPYVEGNLVDICGEYPSDFIKVDISNSPNFVFKNDINFDAVVLLDIEGNNVSVNSFTECEHYVSGGWNFIPNVLYVPAKEYNCSEKSSLIQEELSDYRVYLKDLNIFNFFENENYLCMGKINKTSYEENSKIYEVFYSRQTYILLSQLLPLVLVGLFKLIKVKNISPILFLIIFQFLIQYLFNFKSSFNLFNNVSIFSTLMISFYLINTHYEKSN